MRLALEAGLSVRADRLLDDLWAAEAVNTRRNTLQSKVTRLRRALGDPGTIVGGDSGYRLDIEPAAVDALAVLEDTARAAALLDSGDDRGAADLSTSALERYRGDVLPAAGDWADPHRGRLDDARMKLVEIRCDARLRLGEDSDAIGELEAAVASVRLPGAPVGAADARAVPGGPPGRRAGGLPARPRPADGRPRARSGPAAAPARAADPEPRPGAASPRSRGREPAGAVRRARRPRGGDHRDRRPARARPARRGRRAGRDREDGGRARHGPAAHHRQEASGLRGSRPRRRRTTSSTR